MTCSPAWFSRGSARANGQQDDADGAQRRGDPGPHRLDARQRPPGDQHRHRRPAAATAATTDGRTPRWPASRTASESFSPVTSSARPPRPRRPTAATASAAHLDHAPVSNSSSTMTNSATAAAAEDPQTPRRNERRDRPDAEPARRRRTPAATAGTSGRAAAVAAARRANATRAAPMKPKASQWSARNRGRFEASVVFMDSASSRSYREARHHGDALHPMVLGVDDVNAALAVDGQRPRPIQPARLAARAAPAAERLARRP